MKEISCGVLIFNPDNLLLLGHVTGQKHYDIPKGLWESGESFIDTAIRETNEETGISLHKEDLIDLGAFKYNSKKDLQLFQVNNYNINLSNLVCTSTFEHFYTKKILPEVDGFILCTKDDAINLVAKSMSKVLENIFAQKNNFKNKEYYAK